MSEDMKNKLEELESISEEFPWKEGGVPAVKLTRIYKPKRVSKKQTKILRGYK